MRNKRIFYLLMISLMVHCPPIFANKKHHCFLPRNPVCQKIVKLAPQIPLNYAYQLSNDFVVVSRKYKLPVDLLISIAKQESNFKLETIRQVQGLYYNEENDSYESMTVGSDFCLMQINVRNIDRYNLDARKLTTDSRYCIEAGAKILLSTRRPKTKEEEGPAWWTKYNAVNNIHRKMYHEMVLKHWRQIDPAIDSLACDDPKVEV